MIRQTGILDSGLAPFVYNSKLSEKVMSFTISGHNPDVDTVTEEDLIDTGGDYVYIDTASVLTLVSTSAQDNPAGTGLGNITIVGLDENWDLQTVSIDLNGITPAVTTETFLRVFFLAGTTAALAATPNVVAAGNISCSAGATLQGSVLIGNTATRMAMFTVPRGYSGNLSLAYAAGAKADNFLVKFETRPPGLTFVSRTDLEVADGQFVPIPFDPRTGDLKEMSDVKMRVQAIANNASVRGAFIITIVRNDYLQSLSDSI